MAALGVYVSLKPQPAEKHIRFIIAFIVLFLGGGVVNVVQTRLASKAQEELKTQLSKIQKNTEQPPTVNVLPQVVMPKPEQRGYLGMDTLTIQFLPLPLPEELQIITACKNYGSAAALDVTCVSTVMSFSISRKDFPKTIQELSFKAFLERLHSHPPKALTLIEPGQSAMSDQRIPNYSQELINQIDAGDRTLLFVSVMQFKDGAGKHQTEVCQWLESSISNPLANYVPGEGKTLPLVQPPQDKWHRCDVHNGVKY